MHCGNVDNMSYQMFLNACEQYPVRSEIVCLTFILSNLQAIRRDEGYRHGCKFRGLMFLLCGEAIMNVIPVFSMPLLFAAVCAYILTRNVMSKRLRQVQYCH